jgi:hypothetical protein
MEGLCLSSEEDKHPGEEAAIGLGEKAPNNIDALSRGDLAPGAHILGGGYGVNRGGFSVIIGKRPLQAFQQLNRVIPGDLAASSTK